MAIRMLRDYTVTCDYCGKIIAVFMAFTGSSEESGLVSGDAYHLKCWKIKQKLAPQKEEVK